MRDGIEGRGRAVDGGDEIERRKRNATAAHGLIHRRMEAVADA